jgi:NAD(P)H-dependent flavin oxidoreductase YrpB (nitropropane dioxygenase family)
MSDARPTIPRFGTAQLAGLAGEQVHPMIIQGGMGVAVSNWRLARAVARCGQLGVVSGTGIDTVMVRRLQDGDVGGHVRRAMEHFPFADIVKETLRRYFLPDGRPAEKPYARIPLATVEGNRFHRGLMALAGFTEVFLAKEGHDGPIGMNLLTKIQLPNMATLYGAMLAGVNHVLMGAGIPRDIPGILDELSQHRRTSMRIDATVAARRRAGGGPLRPGRARRRRPARARAPGLLPDHLDPRAGERSCSRSRRARSRASSSRRPPPAATTRRRAAARPSTSAASPSTASATAPTSSRCASLGLPFWLAGSSGSPEALATALNEGAAGVQVGTIFAYCDESGFETAVKQQVIDRVLAGDTDVLTDAKASPTGFPFKVVTLPGSLSESEVYEQRTRVCDLGYLREVVRTDEGKLAYRCASEPVADYVAKGGDIEETVGRKCLCNALMANVGIGQVQKGQTTPELPLVTSGDDLAAITRVLKPGATSYTAAEVVDYLLGRG